MMRWLMLVFLSCALAACGSTTSQKTAVERKYRGIVKIGKPYYVNGKWYYPKYDEDYDETGIASWYGPGFHGNMTANGEVFDSHAEYTAAHPTLPLPSVVRVTNLKNGKTLDVRLNDRGPFKEGRIIDLSRKSAKKLGIDGIAQVRVQYLKKETEKLWADLELTTEASKVIAAHSFDTRNLPVADGQEQGLFDAAGGRQVSQTAPVATVESSDLPGSVVPPAPEPVRRSAPLPLASEANAAESAVTLSGAPPVRMERLAPAPQINSGYYIQAGAFGMKENAYRVAEQLTPVAPANVVATVEPNRTLYRVRLGPFANDAARQEALQRLAGMGYADARLVRE